MVAAGDDRGADTMAGQLRMGAGGLLRRRRDRLGAAGDADRELDGTAGRVSLAGVRPTISRLSKLARKPPRSRDMVLSEVFNFVCAF